jgi:predicted DNA-binding transcriptional regulator AlpA
MNTTPDVLDDYLTDEQLAKALGRSPRTIARWRSLNEAPPATRIGRQILYKLDSVKAWLASREEAA